MLGRVSDVFNLVSGWPDSVTKIRNNGSPSSRKFDEWAPDFSFPL